MPSAPFGSGAMFDGIAKRYDWLNRLSSLGLDARWRRRLCDAVAPEKLAPGAVVVDVATGTADVALALWRRAPLVRVVGIDPSEGMLALGRRKWAQAHHGDGRDAVRLEQGDAQALAYETGRFAAATMAFGIRNVPDRARALAELRRVVAPGGTVAILELTEPGRGVWGALARLWVHRVVPAMGALLSGASAYRYLARSIAAFPPAPEFVEQMRAAGLTGVHAKRLSFGAAHLFVGHVP